MKSSAIYTPNAYEVISMTKQIITKQNQNKKKRKLKKKIDKHETKK